MEIKRKMKVMFDLHGVIGEHPELFKPFMKTLRNSGHEVYICSGPTKVKILQELLDLGYYEDRHFDKVISVVDFLKDQGAHFDYDCYGNPWTDDDTWWRSKGKIAELNEIDLMIDDSEQYHEHILGNTKFLLMK